MHFGKPATAATLAHIRRELVQGVWDLILDDDLIHACVHGSRTEFLDGKMRALFPRFVVYSADYPEK